METHSHSEIIQMQVQIAALTKQVEHHDRILVTGSDEQLSLPEIVRSLTATVNSYIQPKNKEEEEKKEEWDKWRWVILGTAVPATLVFVAQAIIFFFRFVPIMVSISQQSTP